MSLQIIILAAGQGTRMKSHLAKVLHPVAGKPMIEHVLDAAKQLNPDRIHLVYGHQGETLKKSLSHHDINWVHQREQLGTGHAVAEVLPHIKGPTNVLILSGDVPLISHHSLEKLTTLCDNQTLALLTARVDNPQGLGRILRSDNGVIIGIREERDANEHEKQIKEIYSGILASPVDALKRWIPKLSRDNAQGEYYITDCIAHAFEEKMTIQSSKCLDSIEVQGVNDKCQLNTVERHFQLQMAKQLMIQGVTLCDATRFDVRGSLECQKDVFIDANCVFKGQVTLGNNVNIGPNCYLRDVTLEDNVTVYANSVLEECVVGCDSRVGPFARLRPGTKLAQECKVGNFVEIKKSSLARGAKASHLSYLGDAVIGEEVNIGAGTITCNYDGVNKHQTVIEKGAFIGSDSQLVAPVTIGENATIGAGSTIRRNAPANKLTLTEAKQKIIDGWQRPKKQQ